MNYAHEKCLRMKQNPQNAVSWLRHLFCANKQNNIQELERHLNSVETSYLWTTKNLNSCHSTPPIIFGTKFRFLRNT